MTIIELVKSYPDGNWVCYGKLVDGSDTKRVELQRGDGECPFKKGDELDETELNAKPVSDPNKLRTTLPHRDVLYVRQGALANAVARAKTSCNEHHCTCFLDLAEIIEDWLVRPVNGDDDA